MQDKIIKTTLENWKELKPFQPKELKTTDKEILLKLRNSFINNGKINSFAIWYNEKDNIKYIIDGHTTFEIFTQLEKEGMTIPEQFTCNWIDIKDEKEAKRFVLLYNSHYKKIDGEFALSWVDDIDVNSIMKEINIDAIDFVYKSVYNEMDGENKLYETDSGIYMLNVVLNKEQYEKWNTLKESIKIKKDLDVLNFIWSFYDKNI